MEGVAKHKLRTVDGIYETDHNTVYCVSDLFCSTLCLIFAGMAAIHGTPSVRLRGCLNFRTSKWECKKRENNLKFVEIVSQPW